MTGCRMIDWGMGGHCIALGLGRFREGYFGNESRGHGREGFVSNGD
jgi:hypothetical protein